MARIGGHLLWAEDSYGQHSLSDGGWLMTTLTLTPVTPTTLTATPAATVSDLYPKTSIYPSIGLYPSAGGLTLTPA